MYHNLERIQKINGFLKYFHFIEFLHGKKNEYLIIINIIIICIFFLFIFLLLIAFNFKTTFFYTFTFLEILRIIIPLFSISFFGQILNGLLSTNKCINNFAFYNLNQKCKEGILFYFQEILSIIAILFLCIISLFVVSIYYIPIFTKGNSIIKKKSSIPEQIFFFCKIIIILLFYIEDILKRNNNGINNYLIIVMLVVITGINAYFSFVYKNSENLIILLINNIMSLLLFWGFCSLLIGIIFESMGYVGTEYLFIIGTILIILYHYYYHNKYRNEYWQNINYIYTNQERLNYILRVIDIMEKRNNSRKNKIIFQTLLEKIELYCINPHCEIKQYMHQLQKGIDSSFLLYEYCQNLFKTSISKNKNDITAKIYYIIFVMAKLNKRKKAIILLQKLEDRQLILFQDLFNIYRVKKLMEELSYNTDNVEENYYNIKMVNLVQYKKYKKDFNNLLFQISSLYLNFWTLLLSSHNQIEAIEHLNNTGKEIKFLIKRIENTFNKLYNYRNDIKIIRLYANFLKNVLVDKKAYEKYNKSMNNINIENKNFNKEDDYANYNINKLKETDENHWILVSAGDKKYGKIVNISLGICPIIGYKKREIIGNNINILLPNIYLKPHEKMIHRLFYETKNRFYDTLSKKIEYKPEHIAKIVYCKHKSKFLVPFPFRAFFVQTEEGEHLFIMNVIKQQCFTHTKNIKEKEPWCCVLTDKHFIIQTFTPNAFELLGFNTTDIDSGLNITTCIEQFRNDISNNVNDKENTMENEVFNYSSDIFYETANKSFYNAKTIKSENKLKRELTKKEYTTPHIISWIYNHNNNKNNKDNVKIYSRLSSERYEIKINSDNIIPEQKLMLQIKESKIHDNIIGYKFLFKKIKKEKKDVISKSNFYANNNIEQSEFIESDFSEVSNFNEINNTNNNLSPTSTVNLNRRDSNQNIDNNLSLFRSDRPLISSKRRHSQGNLPQKINLNNIAIPFKVDENFLPKNKCNFLFDIKKMCYIYHDKYKNIKKTINNINNLNSTRKKEEDFLNIIINEARDKLLLLKSIHHELTKNTTKNDLISNTLSNSSNAVSSSASNSESESSEITSEEKIESMTQEQLHKHYQSFVVQKMHGSQGNISKFGKNTTFKSQVERKSIKAQALYEKISDTFKENTKINIEFDYYKVNLNNVRFLKYDFYREMIIEENHFNKISKMDKIINDLKNNTKFLNKDEKYPTIEYSHLISTKKRASKKRESSFEKNKKIEPDKKLNISKIIINKYLQQNDKKIEKEKKINEALNKKDKQHSIKKFLLASIFSLLFLYTIGGVNLYMYLEEVSKDKENIKLICDSSDLKFYFNSAVYYVRELTLLNINNSKKIKNGEYTGFPSNNKENYTSLVTNKILEIYSYIHSLNEIIITTELTLSKNATYYLNDKEFFIEALTKDFQITKLRTGLSNALIILDGYLYNLADLTSIVEQNIEDVYPFIHNIFNNAGDLLNIQIELYMNELKKRGNNNIVKIIISHSFIFILLILIIFIISKTYSLVLKNKANYFYIFYGIKIDVIRSLINNCENFIQKLKEDNKTLNEEQELEEKNDKKEEETSILDRKVNTILKSVITNNNNDNYNMLSPNQRKGFINKIISTEYAKREKKNRINYKFDVKMFNICLIIFCIIVFVYLCLIIEDYISFMKLISQISLYINHLQKFHNGILEIINGYREFLFDENTIINGLKSNDYINYKMNEIFSSKFNDNIVLDTYRKKIPGFLDKYDNFHYQSLCSRRNEYYFKSEEECNLHMQGISTYGLSILQTSITEEIRIFKNAVNQLLINKEIIGNLTIYGSQYWHDEDIINEINNRNNSHINYRLYLFNNNSYHKDLNILFINTIYPYINSERQLTINSITDAIENKEIIYIIYFSCFLIIITLLFIIYWLPMINNLNKTIYKTKKMLSLIPLHILASQTNIDNLLNIEIENKYNSNDDI